MNFLDYDHSFCEANLYGGAPEYINSFTSLIISLIGLFGLKYNVHFNNDIYMLYVNLFINGFMSFGYHWTNMLGFGLLDRFGMILIAYTSVSSCVKELCYLYNIDLYNYKLYLIGKEIYFLTMLTLCGFNYEFTFNILFGLYLIFIIFYMNLVYKKKYLINSNIRKLIDSGSLGVKLIISALCCWIITEKLCNYIPILQYLQGHALWHIFIGIGGYLLSILSTGLYLDRKQLLYSYNVNYYYIYKKK